MSSSITIPRRLPLLLVADNVLLPGSSMRIPVRSLRNMNMVKSRLLSRHTLSSTVIGVVPKNASEDETEELSTLHFIGTAAVVVQVTGTNWPRPAYTLLVTGLCRFRIEELLQETPYPVAAVRQLDMLPDDGTDTGLSRKGELGTLAENFREQAAKLVEMLDVSIPVVAKLKKMLDSLPSQHLPDVCTSILKASYNEKLQILDAVDLLERFRKTLPLLMRQIEGLKLLQKARKENIEIVGRRDRGTRSSMRRLFNKVTADIDEEREDGGEELDDMADLAHKIKASQMPEHAHKVAIKELKRLRKMGTHMPEYALIRNYLELMVELPWSKSSKDSLDIVQAREDLDTDHYGLEKLKKRVIEYLAVRQLKNNLKGPILCFVGPPGVGKTSVGRSIAHTLGREFHRISLGGVCDQSDIRGHRRTYIGAMPGRIIHGLKQVGVNNPVFLLDEVDKLGKSMHGDPAAALLEVLDPEQNNSFTDHYLNIHFDLSQVLFIATANNMSTIPAPLLDRMELIQIPGYTQEEKVHIASRHLVAKQLNEHGLTLDQLQIPDESLMILVSRYTREAGVRTLERRIAAVCRAVAVKVAESACKNVNLATEDGEKDDDSTKESSSDELQDNSEGSSRVKPDQCEVNSESGGQLTSSLAHPPEMPIVIDEAAIEDILGPAQYECEMSERLKQPGIAVGLAWTAVGGQIMFVEATSMEGDGKLTLTGQLGDIMKESANLALNWVRSNSKKLGLSIDTDPLDKRDLHIHFPAGAISKDGPSAGVTIVTVLVSLFSDRCVRSDTAMTGEITLRGLVLPVGGIKEKILAAHRAGIQRIILPKRNEKDLIDIPANVRSLLSFVFATRLVDVLNAAFDAGFPALSSPASSLPSKL